VIATSEIEAHGTLISTHALFRFNEAEGVIPAKLFSKRFITACIRTAGRRGHSTDQVVGYDPRAVCRLYMAEAKNHVGQVPAYDFSYLTQIINSLGRRMKTMMINRLWMHMEN
jgi:hypothetical protein